MKRWMYSALIATATLVGCTQNGALSPAQRSATQASGASPGSRVLTVGIANEPPSVGAVAPIAGGFGSSFSYRPFNELLEIVDDRGIAHPALAEALPVLNTDTWQVFPDGTMLTTYRLKPNLTWHDGAKLTADDFVFSYHVLMTPGLGFINGKSAPLNHIDDVQAPDERTIVIHWTSPFPGADVLQQGGSILGLPALPRHILEGVYRDGSPDAFGAHPYWNTAFIGTGPYKLDRWEFGSFIDASAFDGYVFGRPKIDHLKILFVEDPNVALSYLRAGTILFATDSAIDFPQALELKKDWGPTHRGVFQYTARSLRSIVFQFRPEYVNPKSLLDVRVRKAIAYAVDKQAINEALFGGEGQTIDSIFDNRADFYPQIDAVITKYPLDLRSSERLMNDAGFRKGTDGTYSGPDGRFVADYRSGIGAEGDAERAIIGNTLRQAGFDVTETPQSQAQSRDGEARGTFPGMYGQSTGAGESNQVASLSTDQVAGPANRWTGRNRQGWSNAQFDDLAQQLDTTLDRNRGNQIRVQIAKLVSEEVPEIMMFWNLNPEVFVSDLEGPVQTALLATGGASWNMYQWELR